jgi:hypothetical protein
MVNSLALSAKFARLQDIKKTALPHLAMRDADSENRTTFRRTSTRTVDRVEYIPPSKHYHLRPSVLVYRIHYDIKRQAHIT